jgi:hypothetical protein
MHASRTWSIEITMSLAKPLSFLVSCAAFAAVAFVTPEAQAGIEACGNINLGGSASCEFVASGGCETMCTPFSFQAACAGQGAIDCRAPEQCSLTADVACTGECQGSCEAECEINPGSFECAGACRADCSGSCGGDCSAKCEADGGGAECQGQCEASCEASCSTECDASCEVVPANADCVAQCEGCCGGSCTADVNFDCQIDCQADLQVSCEAEMQGGCETACSRPEGALFCDGQFVNYDAVEECVDALLDELNIEVSGYAECSGNSCEAGGSISCFTTIDPERPFGGLLAFFMGIGLLGGIRRGRRDEDLVA